MPPAWPRPPPRPPRPRRAQGTPVTIEYTEGAETGFQREELQPGQSRRVTITADPRLLARFDGPDGINGGWRIADGTYRVAVGRSASELVHTADTLMKARQFGQWIPGRIPGRHSVPPD